MNPGGPMTGDAAFFPSMPTADGETAPKMATPDEVSYEDKFLNKYRDVDEAIGTDDRLYLGSLLREPAEEKTKGVNLSRDPLLSVVIGYGKKELAMWLVEQMGTEDLMARNERGETVLHVVAEQGDIEVAQKIVDRYQKEAERSGREGGGKEILEARNKQQETALHKAALYGMREMFWRLQRLGSDVFARGWEGASVLHCAIMGNDFDLAVEIVKLYPSLMYSRNQGAVTPLQLMVTIPRAFRSTQFYGPLNSIIYTWIPLQEETSSYDTHTADEENQAVKIAQHAHEAEHERQSDSVRSKVLENYYFCYDLLQLFCIPAQWIQVLLFNVLKQVFPIFERLEQHKRSHMQAMKLVQLLAREERYWDFLTKGRQPEPQKHIRSRKKDIHDLGDSIHKALKFATRSTRGEMYKDSLTRRRRGRSESSDDSDELGSFIYRAMKLLILLAKEEKYSDHLTKEMVPDTENKTLLGDASIHDYGNEMFQYAEQKENTTRWDDSPLILGARMGLHEFVKQILMVRPEAALWHDVAGKNVLQVAIEYGHVKIVDIVKSMVTGNNPRLPASILYSCEDKTKNTILHFAAKKTVHEEEATALQMQYELQWFEKVRQLLPKELWNSRNNSEKTAEELFNENHKEMVKKCKDQVIDMGRTGSGILAAVVFASGFSIPGERQSNNAPSFHTKLAFKVFSNAYVIGLSCASTAMVLFLSLLTSSYRQRDFRRSIPAKYFFATLSFFFALVALLVSFSCSIYLNIYGYRKSTPKDLIPFVCELTIFPALCFIVLLFRGTTFGVLPFLRHVWL